jgi:hypothetical protein
VILGTIVVLLLAGTGLLVGAVLRMRTTAELVLAAYLVAFTEVVGLFLFLSLFGAVTRGALVAGAVAVFIAAASAWVLARTPPFPWPRRRTFACVVRSRPLLVLSLCVVSALTYVVALIVGTPPNGWDPLNYHLARAAFWLQSGGVGYIDGVYDQRLNLNPPNAEIGSAFVLGVTRQEELVGFVQFFAALACAAAIFALARRLGLGRAEAGFGSLLFLTLPIVILQSSGAKNDLVLASFLLAAAVFLLRDRRRDITLASLATALAVGTKFTAGYGVLVLLAVLAAAGPARRAARIIGLALGVLAGSYWYAVNAIETGHLLGDQSAQSHVSAPFHAAENLVTAGGMAVDALDLSGAQGRDILVYAVLALVVAAALKRLRQPGGWTEGVLAAAVVASPLVLLALSEQIGRPALLRLYHALGDPNGYLAIGDESSSAPTTASDTASWFGPLGFILVIGAALAAIRFTRRRRSLPLSGAVFAVAPLACFGLLAVTLTYNPWLGRFLMFPVALSAALWGFTLRVRALAWGAVALGATTLFLSLVHYTEKPSGLRLLDRTPAASVWGMSRWQVQSLHDPALGPILQFFDTEVPPRASVGLALSENEFAYPIFGPHLQRRVESIPFGSNARDVHAEWLLATSERVSEIDPSCWRSVFQSAEAVVFRRAENCA